MNKITKAQQEALQGHIDSLTPDLKPMVKSIEASIKTTQNHYGRYMELISTIAGNDKVMIYIVAEALVAAGANREGVKSAVRIFS